MMQLLWTPDATQDRETIYDYIEQRNPAAAIAIDKLFLQQTMLLAQQPQLGKAGRVAGTRELVAHKNYIVIYDLHVDTVRILRILHAAQQWTTD